MGTKSEEIYNINFLNILNQFLLSQNWLKQKPISKFSYRNSDFKYFIRKIKMKIIFEQTFQLSKSLCTSSPQNSRNHLFWQWQKHTIIYLSSY